MTLGQHKAKELMGELKDTKKEAAASIRAREAIEIQAGPFWESLHTNTKILVDDFLGALPINTGIRCTLVNPNHLTIYREVFPLLTLDVTYVPKERVDISYKETQPALANSKESAVSYCFCVDSKPDYPGFLAVFVMSKDRTRHDAIDLANDVCDRVGDFIKRSFTAA
jgi:hypothetical protein